MRRSRILVVEGIISAKNWRRFLGGTADKAEFGRQVACIYRDDGTRSRKDVSGDCTEYVYFGGQVIAEKNSAGDWTDYIFANGQRIAKAEGLNRDLEIKGTTTGSGQYALFYFGNAAGLNGYTIRSGDKLEFTQYQPTGSKGGMVLGFTDGSASNWTVKDQDGYYLNDDQKQNNTHVRTVDLSSLARPSTRSR